MGIGNMGSKLIFKLIFIAVIFSSCLLGLRRIAYYGSERNKCEMTYMFEYPQYIKVELKHDLRAEFPRYGLYVYGEGEQAEKYYKKKFKGLPVLFLPGNAGSYKQVRSLASMAYRKAIDSRKNFRFDFFTIDFDEEFSALHGGLLERQAAFARLCIKQILDLYNKDPHTSVLLIGHSMGGVIAKAVFDSSDEFDPRVNTIITLATPHRDPVVAIDSAMINFYNRVEQEWDGGLETTNITLASIGGSDRDFQVRSGLTVARQTSINVLTTEIPGAWMSVDHLCIAWCKQVVKAVVRSLFDMVTISPSTSKLQWIDDPELRREILNYHLIEQYGGKSWNDGIQNEDMVDFDPDGRWREVIAPRFTAKMDEEDRGNTYFMIPLVDNAHRSALAAVATGLSVRHWVFGCVAGSWKNNVRFCERGVDLSPQTTLLPNVGDNVKRKLIQLDLADLRLKYGFSHVIFNLPKNFPKARIQIDINRFEDRNSWLKLPLFSYLLPGFLGFTEIDATIPPEVLSYNLTLPDFTRAWQSLAVTVDCPEGRNRQSPVLPALIRKVVPWSRESQFFLTNQSFTVHLHVPKTVTWAGVEEAVHLQLINPTNSQCRYQITIKPDWPGMWSQLMRFYGPLLFSLVAALFLYCLAVQLKARADQITVPSTLSCLLHLPLIKTAIVAEAVVMFFGLMDSLHLHWWPLPVSDDYLLRQDGLHFRMMYTILGAIAWAWAVLLSILFWIGVSFGGNTLHSFVLRYLRGSLGISSIIAEAVTMGLSRMPVVIAVVLLAIGLATCGSLAILLGLVVCIWKLFEYYEDELESMLSEEESQESDDGFNVNMTVAIMWLCSLLLAIPALVIWVKNPHLTGAGDHTILPGIVWSVFGMIVLQKSGTIRPECIITYKHVSYVLTILSLLIPAFGFVSLYRVQYFLAAGLIVYASRQLM